MRTGDPTMTTMSMGGGYLHAHGPAHRIHGVPALAIRLGRFLELWGYRAARPMDSERAELVLRARRRETVARAAREATVVNAWNCRIR
jgi:hypothetical protein